MFVILVLTDVTFKQLSAGWHLIKIQDLHLSWGENGAAYACVDSFSRSLLRRSAKSTVNVSVSPSAVARCRLRAPTVQPRPPRPDPQPATHLPHRYGFIRRVYLYEHLGVRRSIC